MNVVEKVVTGGGISSKRYPSAAFLWRKPRAEGRLPAYRKRNSAIDDQGRHCLAPLKIPATDYRRWMTDLPVLLALARRAMEEFPIPTPRDRLSQLAEGWRGRTRIPPSMRADGIMCKEGLRLCELNMTPGGNGGAWQTAFMSHWLGVSPDPRDGIRAILRSLVASNGGKLVVGVLEGAGRNDIGWAETRDLLTWFKEVPGVRPYLTDVNDLRPKRERMSDGLRIYDALYPMYAFEVRARTDSILGLLQSVVSTSTIFITDPIDLRIDDKALMALLSAAADAEFEAGFSAKECSLVRRYIPWTRLLNRKPGFVPVSTVMDRRAHLVLKRTRSLNSMHVKPGFRYTPTEWRTILDAAARSRLPWIVQERLVPKPQIIHTPSGLEQRDCMVCPFIFGRTWAGALVRVAEREPRPFTIAYRPTVLLTVTDSLLAN